VKHRGKHRVGSPMAGDVNERDPRCLAAVIKVCHNVRPPGILGHFDPGFHVVALVEIHIYQVVAANDAVQAAYLGKAA
jgi:hypothetical protein